jgi:hypothetical protein
MGEVSYAAHCVEINERASRTTQRGRPSSFTGCGQTATNVLPPYREERRRNNTPLRRPTPKMNEIKVLGSGTGAVGTAFDSWIGFAAIECDVGVESTLTLGLATASQANAAARRMPLIMGSDSGQTGDKPRRLFVSQMWYF